MQHLKKKQLNLGRVWICVRVALRKDMRKSHQMTFSCAFPCHTSAKAQEARNSTLSQDLLLQGEALPQDKYPNRA
jgi:hypothetical protein